VSGWTTERLGDICTKITDGTHHSPPNHPTGDYRYVTAKNIKPWGLDLADITYVDAATHTEIYARCDVKKDDILYIKDGATTGRAALNTLEDEFSLLSSVGVLRPGPRIKPKFLLYALQAPHVLKPMLADVAGVAITRLTLKKLKDAVVPLAPIEQQDGVVAEIEKQFSRLDEAVAGLQRVKANLKRYKAAVLKAAVEGRLVPTEADLTRREGRNYETGAQLLHRILESRRSQWQGKGKYKEPVAPDTANLPVLPKGWVWSSVSQLLREPIVNGLSIKESTVPTATRALRLSAMTDLGIDYNDYRYLPVPLQQVKDIVVRESDFFVSRGNGSLHLVGRGSSAQTPTLDVIFPDTMMRVRFTSIADVRGWVQALWSSRFVRVQVEKRAKTTAGIYKIAQPELASISIPLPPLAEQQRIVAEVDRLLSIAREAEAEVEANLKRAQGLRQAILARSFQVGAF